MPATPPQYGSDVMVDTLKALDLRYLAMNPGASFRGLHDSIVNYADNSPELIQCTHEKIAVNIAHGYAKATGRAMGVILHDLVGLLQGAMGIYYAFQDRAPILILGGSGPQDTAKRRPNIDWFHTANVQGNAVRDYTKWDDQPASIEAVAPALQRGYRVATQGPEGPVYIALDAALQEAPVEEGGFGPWSGGAPTIPTELGAAPGAIATLADALVGARQPVIVAGYVGRDPGSFALLVELAEMTGAGVYDTHERLNFTNRHPLYLPTRDALARADLILLLDTQDTEHVLMSVDSMSREKSWVADPDATIMSLGFNDVGIPAWSHSFGALMESAYEVTADATVVLPEVVDACRQRVAEQSESWLARRDERRAAHAQAHAAAWEDGQRQIEAAASRSPVATAWLAEQIWQVVQHHDWVLTAGTLRDWVFRTWDFDEPHRHPGKSLGTATQIGISLGVALAHKGTGRLVVDIQPDGDLLFDVGALWTAAYHELPILVVMYNNRAYYNDWDHQEVVAIARDRPVENAYLGMELGNPDPHFASLARSFGWYADGPIDDPSRVQEAIAAAAAVVAEEGRPALVDIVCEFK